MKHQSEKILLAGGSGLVGSILQERLGQHGKEVHILTRSQDSHPFRHQWDPDNGFIASSISDHAFEALINLCGAGIADQRWTSSRKKVLYDSRIVPTQFLWSLIKNQTINTAKFIQISASGFYGNRDKPVDEKATSGPEHDFMVQLTKDWESAFLSSATKKVPHCRLRLGVVISEKGGFISQFRTPIRFYMAPYFGAGDNYISWVHEADLANMIHRLIESDKLAPIYNLATPYPVTSKQFAKSLKKVFNSNAILMRIPVFALKLLFGEMKSAILADVRMMPGEFENISYNFLVPRMKEALEKVK